MFWRRNKEGDSILFYFEIINSNLSSLHAFIRLGESKLHAKIRVLNCPL